MQDLFGGQIFKMENDFFTENFNLLKSELNREMFNYLYSSMAVKIEKEKLLELDFTNPIQNLKKRFEYTFTRYKQTYRVVAIPDMVNKNTIFEFKTLKNSNGLNNTIKIASLQADVTGYLFKKKFIEVIVFQIDHNKTTFYKRLTDEERAEKHLEKTIKNLIKYKNGYPIFKADRNRCKNCKFNFTNKCN